MKSGDFRKKLEKVTFIEGYRIAFNEELEKLLDIIANALKQDVFRKKPWSQINITISISSEPSDHYDIEIDYSCSDTDDEDYTFIDAQEVNFKNKLFLKQEYIVEDKSRSYSKYQTYKMLWLTQYLPKVFKDIGFKYFYTSGSFVSLPLTPPCNYLLLMWGAFIFKVYIYIILQHNFNVPTYKCIGRFDYVYI